MENKNTAKNFLFYRSFYEAIREFEDNDRLALYDSIVKYAFENQETEFTGMKKAIFSMATPLISASIKNYQRGVKGGRPRNQQPETPEEQPEVFYTGLGKDVEDFIADYKAHKSADFEPTTQEKEKISIILKDLGSYKKDYWVKIFNTAKYGFDINGETVPCTLTKILLEHNKIFRGELKFKPNKELEEQKKKEYKEKVKKEKDEYNKVVEEELQERETAKSNIKNISDAVEYLNTYVAKGVKIRQISADYKELRAIYPNIAIDCKGVYYDTKN